MTKEKSIWHSTEEKPERNSRVLFTTKNGDMRVGTFGASEFINMDMYWHTVVEWSYTDDIKSLEQENQRLKEENDSYKKGFANASKTLGTCSLCQYCGEQLTSQLQSLKDFLANEVKPVVGFYENKDNYDCDYFVDEINGSVGQAPLDEVSADRGSKARELNEKIDEVLR